MVAWEGGHLMTQGNHLNLVQLETVVSSDLGISLRLKSYVELKIKVILKACCPIELKKYDVSLSPFFLKFVLEVGIWIPSNLPF